jgi:hypothetical protein
MSVNIHCNLVDLRQTTSKMTTDLMTFDGSFKAVVRGERAKVVLERYLELFKTSDGYDNKDVVYLLYCTKHDIDKFNALCVWVA